MGPRLLLDRVRRRLLLHRRALAALAAAAAVLCGLQAARPPDPATRTVWTAAHDLAGGHVLRTGDLRAVPFAAATAPTHRAGAGALVGRSLVAPVRSGQPLTDLSVVGRELVDRYGDRTVAPVRIADAAAAALLRPGDRVDLVAGDPSGDGAGRVVSPGALVVSVPTASPTGAADGGPSGRLVLVAVPDDDATAVTLAGLAGLLDVTWVH